MNEAVYTINRKLNLYRKIKEDSEEKYNFFRTTDKLQADLLRAELKGIALAYKFMGRKHMANYIINKIIHINLDVNKNYYRIIKK